MTCHVPEAAIKKNGKVQDRWEWGTVYEMTWTSSGYTAGTVRGIIKAHAVERSNEEDAWPSGYGMRMKGRIRENGDLLSPKVDFDPEPQRNVG